MNVPDISLSLCLPEPVMWSLSLCDGKTNITLCPNVDIHAAYDPLWVETKRAESNWITRQKVANAFPFGFFFLIS